ncbi:MAG: S-adenosylmethionine:tRNA ribosyltransferase-isomerase [Tetrasphaera sp.]
MTILAEHSAIHFSAPPDAYAHSPVEERGLPRDRVRLLVAGADGIRHACFRDLPEQLRAGDVVVVNDSATVAGQLDAELAKHGPIVVHLATPLEDGTWVVELRTAPDAGRAVLDAEPGDLVTAGPVTITLLEPYPYRSSPTGSGNRLWRVRASHPLEPYAAAHGRPIAYGYLDRAYPLTAYQTVFATVPGSAEMPSAARPFTTDIVTRLVSRGIAVAPVTLHTGVSSQEAGEGPQPERFRVPEATARLVTAARAGGGRVVAVGTTVTRALESAVDDAGRLVARSGWTERVVTPAHPPRIVTGLITGWHDPAASHLLLVEAVAGAVLAQRAYDAAVAEGYLWHEFGDSALFLPG